MLILAPIITLSIVIFMHELGHFIAARLNKVKVEDFSIGFGPKIFSFKRKDTQYSLRMIPFGGFNRMAGEEYNENKPITEDMFIAKPIKNRLSIIAAGPLGNLISGFFICILGFLIGIKTYTLPAKIDKVEKNSIAYKSGLRTKDIILKVDDKPIGSWQDLEKSIFDKEKCKLLIKRNSKLITIKLLKKKDELAEDIGITPYISLKVGGVIKNYPAYKAGLRPGDLILKVNGKELNSWQELVKIIHDNPNKLLNFKIKRKEKILNIKIHTKEDKILQDNRIKLVGKIGIRPHLKEKVQRFGLKEAIYRSFVQTFWISPMYVYIVIKGLREGKVSLSDFAGPLGIMHFATEQAKAGLGTLLLFIAFLSVQLCILNLLPLPALDGGHAILLLIESIRKKPISHKIQSYINIIGFSLLITLLLVVTYNDILRLIFR